MIDIYFKLDTIAKTIFDRLNRQLRRLFFISFLIVFTSVFWVNTSPAMASIDNDKYEGNIFILYAGNGSLVPPRIDLKESLKRGTPVILVYYIDDSSDCKQYSFVVSRLQEFYGRAATIIPVSVDSLALNAEYAPNEPGYYYEGKVPQTVILNQEGEVVFNKSGQQKYEAMDDVLRDVFDLVPRSESVQLKRRSFNEYNAEITD
jgi:hypothetical protein